MPFARWIRTSSRCALSRSGSIEVAQSAAVSAAGKYPRSINSSAIDSNAHSRGQVWRLDEQNRTATLILNADLGAYSYALGAAQKLSNGNYHFGLGWLPSGSSQSVEVDPAGNVVYAIEAGTQEYRTFRMRDMYTPGR